MSPHDPTTYAGASVRLLLLSATVVALFLPFLWLDAVTAVTYAVVLVLAGIAGTGTRELEQDSFFSAI